MRSYSERKVFTRATLALYHTATSIVCDLPSFWASGGQNHCRPPADEGALFPSVTEIPVKGWSEIRCHELARAVAQILALEHPIAGSLLLVVDGHHGAMEHTWLVVGDQRGHAILDVYSPGRMPPVQLVAPTALLPDQRAYREGDARQDIDHALVEAMVAEYLRWSQPKAVIA